MRIYSKFYYGHTINIENQYLNFIEPTKDNVQLTAILNTRSYSFEDMGTEISRAMNTVGLLDYVVTTNRTDRTYTIISTEDFNLLTESGTQLATSPFNLLGFETGTLRAQGLSHTTDFGSGSVYQCQAPLWGYTPFKHWGGASDGSIAKAASGRTSIVSFGSVQSMECTISCITNSLQMGASGILNNENGEDDALDFLKYITKKRPIEFMESRDNSDDFIKCRVESTKSSKEGITYRLYEGSNGKKVKGLYNSGQLIFESLEI